MHMIIRLTIIFLLSFNLISCASSVDDQMVNGGNKDSTKVDISYKEKAKAVYDMIQAKYRNGNLYKENYPSQGNDEVSYLWPYVGMLTGANLLYELGYGKSILEKEFGGVENYFVKRSELPAYQGEPTSKGLKDIFYDDNCIVAMEFIDAYKLTSEQKYLDKAIILTDFIMSGEDGRMGGGLYWFEAASKNCQTGPNCMKAANTTAYAAFVASDLYKLTKDSKHLAFAKKVYDWNYKTLRDKSDNLYWNDINIGTGQINPTKWTYNAAMMIMSGVNLYEITKDRAYLEQAIITARNSFSRFTKVIKDQLFFQTNDSWFNVELMTSYIKLSEHDAKSKDYVEAFIKNADFAWKNARNSEGQFYEDWSGTAPGRYYWLLHQAALIEAYGRAAIYKGEK